MILCQQFILPLLECTRKWGNHTFILLIAGIPLKNEDEWPSVKVFVHELLVMLSGIAAFHSSFQ
jgi:hypothetical protein